MKRREFVSLVGAGSMMPLAIAACQSPPQDTGATEEPAEPTTSDNPSPESESVADEASASMDGFELVGTVADLNANGQLLVEETALGAVLVIPDPADSNALVAVNPTCTHRGCTVEWLTDQTRFVCPCHDAAFATDGQVLEGPATDPIPVYEVMVEGDSVYVKAS
jgi:cytochrome b6-f complex iron-sulfur subunit